MDVKNKDVCESLLGNKRFLDLSGAAESLGKQMDYLKSLGGKGFGPLFNPALVAKAKTVLASGVDTAATTYALYQLTAVIPNIESIFDRKDAIKKLRADVAYKGTALGASLEARAVILETQARPSKESGVGVKLARRPGFVAAIGRWGVRTYFAAIRTAEKRIAAPLRL